jgi:hypothetical protein
LLHIAKGKKGRAAVLRLSEAKSGATRGKFTKATGEKNRPFSLVAQANLPHQSDPPYYSKSHQN